MALVNRRSGKCSDRRPIGSAWFRILYLLLGWEMALNNAQTPKHNAKWTSMVQARIKGQMFDRMDLTPMIGFLQAFTMTCENNCIHEEAKLRLFLRFTRMSAVAALTTRLSLQSKLSHYSAQKVCWQHMVRWWTVQWRPMPCMIASQRLTAMLHARWDRRPRFN